MKNKLPQAVTLAAALALAAPLAIAAGDSARAQNGGQAQPQQQAGAMQRAPSTITVMPAADLTGRPLVDQQGRNAGQIDSLVLDTGNGAVEFVVIGGNGNLNLNGQVIAVPWSVLVPPTRAQGAITIKVGADKLAQAPRLNRQALYRLNQPNMRANVYGYYGVPYGYGYGNGPARYGYAAPYGGPVPYAYGPVPNGAAYGAPGAYRQGGNGGGNGATAGGYGSSAAGQGQGPGQMAAAAPYQQNAGGQYQQNTSGQQQQNMGGQQQQNGGGQSPQNQQNQQNQNQQNQAQNQRRLTPNQQQMVQNGLVVGPSGAVSVLQSRMARSAQGLQSANVFSPNGGTIGRVDQVMIDVDHGQVAFVLMERGGFLGLNASWYALPVEALAWSPYQGGYRLTVDPNLLNSEPSVPANRNQLPTLVSAQQLAQLYRHFGIRPYWQQ